MNMLLRCRGVDKNVSGVSSWHTRFYERREWDGRVQIGDARGIEKFPWR